MTVPRWTLLAGFAALALAQLAAPLLQIAKYEAVIAYGAEYKFKTAPVDPPDVLRGRYVALDFVAADLSCEEWQATAAAISGSARARRFMMTEPPVVRRAGLRGV